VKQGEVSLLLLFNFALERAISKVQGNHLEIKFSGTYQLLVYAGDDNLLGISVP
jgi:hypothetical protein